MVPSDFGLTSEPTPQCAHQHVAERPSEIGKKTANPDQVLASLTHAKANTPAKINKMGWSWICSLEGSLYLVAGALCCLPR